MNWYHLSSLQFWRFFYFIIFASGFISAESRGQLVKLYLLSALMDGVAVWDDLQRCSLPPFGGGNSGEKITCARLLPRIPTLFSLALLPLGPDSDSLHTRQKYRQREKKYQDTKALYVTLSSCIDFMFFFIPFSIWQTTWNRCFLSRQAGI